LLKDKNHNSWFKNLLVAGLKTEGIHRLKIMDHQTVEELEFIPIGERVRDICEGLNGVFYISTDAGQVYQFTPK
jgi:glucose/arabinose dehydrogenase